MEKKSKITDIMRSAGLSPRNWSNRLIAEEALSRGITIEKHQKKRAVLLTQGKKTHHWRNGVNSLNHRLAVRVVNQKDVTSRLLRNGGHNAPENAVFAKGQASRAWSWAREILPVVIKPRDGLKGANVHVEIVDKQEFTDFFDEVSSIYGEALVEKFHSGVEHRCLLVDYKLVAVTYRRPASVVGDGHSSIQGLIEQKNLDRGRIHKPIGVGKEEVLKLKNEGLTLESIPASESRVFLRGTSNLHTGGDAVDATESVTVDERLQIESMARGIPGLRIAGFDILLPRAAGHSSLAVLEVNKAPMITMHHFPWEGRSRPVARSIVDAMFPKTRIGD